MIAELRRQLAMQLVLEAMGWDNQRASMLTCGHLNCAGTYRQLPPQLVAFRKTPYSPVRDSNEFPPYVIHETQGIRATLPEVLEIYNCRIINDRIVHNDPDIQKLWGKY